MSQPTRRPRNQSASPTSPARRRAPPASVDYQALARFRYQLRLFLAFSETAARKAGLTAAAASGAARDQGLLAGPAPASVGDLARFLLIRHHTAVELVNRMAKLGLLSRLIDGDDGRRVLVQLTTKGRAEAAGALQDPHRGAAIGQSGIGQDPALAPAVARTLGRPHAAAPWAASCAAWCSVVSASINSPSASPEITCGNL